MQSAYILISCNPEDSQQIISSLLNISGLVEAKLVEGPYDIIVKIQAENSEKLKEIISIQLRRIGKIKHTLTLTAM
ncbi:MAG TPA: Lrp/AsnC ligand binding domain-containing protein [Nitrososphaeraceae archaeon]|jgi:DNA-binding Lrp family transcriptional regulator